MCFFTENASNFSYDQVGRLQRALGIWELAVLDKSQRQQWSGWVGLVWEEHGWPIVRQSSGHKRHDLPVCMFSK